MSEYVNVDLDKIYADDKDFPLGAIHRQDRMTFVFVKYNQGDGAEAGAAGKLAVGLDSAYPDYEVTLDSDSATIKAIPNDLKGFLQAALTNATYGWAQTWGRNRKAAVTGGGVDAQGEQVMLHGTTAGALDTHDASAKPVAGVALEIDSGNAIAIGQLMITILP